MNITNNHTHTITAMHDIQSSMNSTARRSLSDWLSHVLDSITKALSSMAAEPLLDWSRIIMQIKRLASMQGTQQYGSAYRCYGNRGFIALAHQPRQETDLEPQPRQRA